MPLTPDQTQIVCSSDIERVNILQTFSLSYGVSFNLDVSNLPINTLLYFSVRHHCTELGWTPWSTPVGIYLSDLVRWLIRWTSEDNAGELKCITTGSDGALYTAGIIYINNVAQVCFGKFDVQSNTIWIRYISIPTVASSVGGLCIDVDGNIQIIINLSPQGIAFLKIDPNTEEILLQKKYTNTNVKVYSLCTNTEDTMYAIGYDTNTNSAVLIKYSTTLSIIWQKHIYQSSSVQFVCVRPTSDGGCVLCGVYTKPGGWYGIICKIRSNGSSQWSKYLTTANTFCYKCAIIDEDDSVILVGYSINSGLYKGLIVKLDSNGTMTWSRIIDGPVDATASTHFTLQSVFLDQNNDVVYCGGHAGNAFLAKIDLNGNDIWQKSINTLSIDNYCFKDVCVDNTNKIYTVGPYLVSATDDGDGYGPLPHMTDLLWVDENRSISSGSLKVSNRSVTIYSNTYALVTAAYELLAATLALPMSRY